MIELVEEKPKEINGLFGVPKDGGKSQRLILDARRANLHFTEPEDPDLPHPGLLTQLEMGGQQEELYVGKLDADNFYHRLRLPEHLRTYFGLPPLLFEGKKVWPRLKSVPMGWSHSVAVSQAVHGEILFAEAGLDPKDEVREGNSKTRMAVRFGRYIDDFFIFGTSKRRVCRAYDKVWNAFTRRKLPPKPKKCVRPAKMPVTVLGMEIHPNGRIEPDPDKMNKVLDVTSGLIKERVWNVAKLQHVLGSWNWFLLLARPVMSVLRVCYDLSSSEKLAVKPNSEAKHELRMLMALAPLIHANIGRPTSDVMLCSDASMDGGATLYSDHLVWHKNQAEIVGKASRAVLYEKTPPICPLEANREK